MIKKTILWFEQHKKISIFCLVITILTMWYFSAIPGISTNLNNSIWPSIIYHFSIFSIFTFFFLTIIGKKLEVKIILITILFSSIIAILDEIHQYFIPMRSCDIKDVLIDLSGIIFMLVLYPLIKNQFFKNKSKI